MTTLQAGEGSAGRLEMSKADKAEETSTQYQPPTCEDYPISLEKQGVVPSSAQSPPHEDRRLRFIVNEDSRSSRFSQATTAVAVPSRNDSYSLKIGPSSSKSRQMVSPPPSHRRSRSPLPRPPIGSQNHNPNTNEGSHRNNYQANEGQADRSMTSDSGEEEDEWRYRAGEVEAEGNATRPRQTPNPNPFSQHERPSRITHISSLPYNQIPSWPYSVPYMGTAPNQYPDTYLPYAPPTIPNSPVRLSRQFYPSSPRLQRSTPLVPTSVPAPLVPSPPSPHATAPEASEPTINTDPISLVEAYLETLKKAKEKELLDANRILSWIDRYSSPKNVSTQAQEVEIFQNQNDEPYTPNSPAASIVTSYARTTAPARSTLEQPTFGAKIPGETAEELLDKGTKSSTRNLYTDNTVCGHIPSNYTTRGASPKAPEHDRTISQADVGHGNYQSIDLWPGNSAGKIVSQEIDSLRQDVTTLKRQLNCMDANLFGSGVSSTYARWKKRFRRGPRPGTQRLEWRCECGEELFADLPIANSTQYQQMLAFLTRPASVTLPVGHGHSHATLPDLESGTAHKISSSPQSNLNSFGNGKAPTSITGSGSTYVGSSSSQSFTLQQSSLCPRTKYLELCVNVGNYETKLGEIQIIASSATGSTICTDAHLFRKIYDRYFALRKHTWRRFLYRPSGIRFVHFGVQAGHRVSFFTDSPLPSEEILASKRYEYTLQPPVPPPIDSRTFLHYFWKHSSHSQSTSARYVDRLPKKLGESLIRSLEMDELREGWGIYILEGPNKAGICWALLAVLVMSFGVSVGYDLVRKAEDSGFAIGQWMVAALTVALSALYFSLEDEVNSSFD